MANSKLLQRQISDLKKVQSNESLKNVYSDGVCIISAILYYLGGKNKDQISIVYRVDKCPREYVWNGKFTIEIRCDPNDTCYRSMICEWKYSGKPKSRDFIIFTREKLQELFEQGKNPRIVISNGTFTRAQRLNFDPPRYNNILAPFTTSIPKVLIKSSNDIYRESYTYASDGYGFCVFAGTNGFNVNLSFLLLNPPSRGSVTGTFKVWIKGTEDKEILKVNFSNSNLSPVYQFMSCIEFLNLYKPDGPEKHEKEIHFDAKFVRNKINVL